MLSEKACPVPEPLSSRIAAILLLAILFFVNFLGRFIFAPLMLSIEKEMGFSHSQAGTIFLMISLGFFFSSTGIGFCYLATQAPGNHLCVRTGSGIGSARF